MARCWYVYFGGNVTLPSSYGLATVKPACVNGPVLCAIYTPDCGESPAFISTNMRRYIANALSTTLAQPQAPVGTKKYVYVKYS